MLELSVLTTAFPINVQQDFHYLNQQLILEVFNFIGIRGSRVAIFIIFKCEHVCYILNNLGEMSESNGIFPIDWIGS